ncbi:MAG: hypothetical protein M1816_004406 [Peltula sp. TS41687]|nr:MAG: hypothetical protein M1816_004406 [Peltula sp. TS41687]
MKLSLSIVAVLAGLAVATPIADGSKSSSGPPGPPHGKSFKSIKQSCSAKQSSIRCCNQTSNGSSKASSKSKVKHGVQNFDLFCNDIHADDSKVVSDICSTTVACCIGDGCVAIAN